MYNKFAEYEQNDQYEEIKREKSSFDIQQLIKKLIPEDFDRHDVALILLLFLLYVESDDSDFLIVLAVIAFSMFRGKGSLFDLT